jgi:hypothetical protein
VSLWWDDDGSLQIRGRLAPEDGGVVAGALDAALERLREDRGGSAEPPGSPLEPPTMAEALVSLAGGAAGFEVVVHVDADALADGEGACVVDDGPALAPETARRLACDVPVVRMSERAGRAVNVGRRTRTVPTPLRRALRARDGTCRFPGCERRRYVHAHHIRHWAHGGPTDLDNLVLLCSRHHRLVHEGGYSVRAVGRQLVFTGPRGLPIPDVHRPPPGDCCRLAGRDRNQRTLRHQRMLRNERTLWPGDGGRMDLGLAVDALLRATARTRPPRARAAPGRDRARRRRTRGTTAPGAWGAT